MIANSVVSCPAARKRPQRLSAKHGVDKRKALTDYSIPYFSVNIKKIRLQRGKAPRLALWQAVLPPFPYRRFPALILLSVPAASRSILVLWR